MPYQLPNRLGRYFFNGLVTLLPLIITLYVFRLVLSFADNLLVGPFKPFLGKFDVPGLGLITTFSLIIFVGAFTTNILFNKLLVKTEALLLKIPLIKSVYATVKQINDILFLQNETKSFRRVCAIEYPRKGIYSIGFLTGKATQEFRKHGLEDMVNVFIPNTPSPATGFFVVISRHEVILLDMTLEDALKIIVSGGALSTKEK